MSFSIYLKVNKSERNKILKETTTILTLTGELKEDTSIISPIIKLDCNLTDIVSCNYLSIPTFKRSYFINNIKSINNRLVEISCHCDVLSSFSSQILDNTAIIRRQENLWNLYLNDSSFKIYQNPNVLTKEFPNGFTTLELVLAVAGS